MRLPHVIPFSRSPIYFFTACVEDRRRVLACEPAFSVIRQVWERSAGLDGWYVGRFTIMPDHIHFAASPGMEAKSRGDWHKTWKGVTARRLAKMLQVTTPFWQEDTLDHILRSQDSYEEKWHYMRENPVRAGLCLKVDDWPWQGEIHPLRWKDE